MVKLKENKSLRGQTLKKNNQKTLKKLAIAIVISVFAATLYTAVASHTHSAKQRVELQKTYQQLETTQRTLNEQQVKDTETQKKLDDTNKKLEETQKQLEAKRNTAIAYAAAKVAVPVAPAAKPTPPTTGGSTNCGDNIYKQYIYQKESGCRTTALNSIGCYGIGQSCPASKISHCGADFACQDAWFSNYAIGRYGSWEAAYNFWLKNHWW